MINPMKSFPTSLLASVAIALFVSSSWMLLFEEDYIYFPTHDVFQTPTDAGLAYRDLQITTSDGIVLHGWYIPAPQAELTLLHFHGNAGNISHRVHLYKRWHNLGLNVLTIDYRGYGKSSGTPSEQGLNLDAETTWQYLTEALGASPESVIIAGRSLGAAIASRLARGKKVTGLVLETPFTSIPDMAAQHYPWLPVRPLIRTQLNTLEHVRKVSVPLLLIAAVDDEIAPLTMAERVFQAAGRPKLMVTLSGSHNDFDDRAEGAYTEAWKNWLGALKSIR